MDFRFSLFLSICFWSLLSQANLDIPSNMDVVDRRKATEILGLSSSSKILGNPYPLGGFTGVEIGYSTEIIPTSELSRLGNKSSSQSETTYQVITLGKGLYNNIDVYVHFAPQTQAEAITGFGGQLRWGFYQAEYLPAHLSLITYANSMSFQNKINTTSQGTDLVTGFSVEDVTLYTGIGVVRTLGTFAGGVNGVTDTGDTAREDISESHYVAGLNIKYSTMFLAMQIDRYTQATYSAKLGFRF